VDSDKELVNKLKEAIQQKIDKRKSQFHESHNKVYNDNLQIEIDTLEWTLEQMQMYAKVMTTERIKAIVEAKIKDLERRMEKTRYLWDTDTLFTKIENRVKLTTPAKSPCRSRNLAFRRPMSSVNDLNPKESVL
jgi:hypothetical protein